MKINPAIPKLSFKYGVVGGILAFVAFLVFHYIGLTPGNLLSFIATLIVVGMFTFLPMKDFKSNVNNGEFRFYHGMTIAFISYLTIASIYGILFWVFMELIEPDYLATKISILKDNFINQKEQRIEEFGLEEYERQLRGLDQITVSAEIISEFAKRVFFGLFLAPIFSIVLRTRQR